MEQTFRDLTNRMLAQDARWATAIDRMRRRDDPAAKAALQFYQTTWQLALSRYFDTIAARNMTFEPVHPAAKRSVLDMLHGLYIEARKAGLPEASFLFPTAVVSTVTSGSERGRSLAGTAKTVAVFALFAVPAGLLISKVKERQQILAEKAAFRQLGLDWEKRFQE